MVIFVLQRGCSLQCQHLQYHFDSNMRQFSLVLLMFEQMYQVIPYPEYLWCVLI